MEPQARYLMAKQAAEALGVTLPTLYAYTSRGQLRSEPVPGRSRERRYFREDIDRLRDRKEVRRDPAKAAARGLHWGSPVLSSGITLIRNGRLYYRGLDVLALARTATLEQVAALLWEAEESVIDSLLARPVVLPAKQLAYFRGLSREPLVAFQAALPLAGVLDPASYDLRPAAVRQTGARILSLLAALAAGRDSAGPMHRALQEAWAPRRPEVADAIRAALVVCADHELNVSAFTARCAASAGASPYDVLSAAMAALKGPRHGGAAGRVAALFDEIRTPARARRVLGDRLRRGDELPGFGHPLYPSGDPRAELLIRLAESHGSPAERRLLRALGVAGRKLLQDAPNLDFGLVALARACRLPEHAPVTLFALGRSAGWIAHAVEQYATGELIRPRANYTGPLPEESA